jgi:hypothetical protein
MSSAHGQTRSWRWLPPLLLLAAAIISIGLPVDWLRPLDLVGNAVCHRIAERSFFVTGRQLPLCARDTGMFSTALLGLLYFGLRLRQPAADPPRPPFHLLLHRLLPDLGLRRVQLVLGSADQPDALLPAAELASFDNRGRHGVDALLVRDPLGQPSALACAGPHPARRVVARVPAPAADPRRRDRASSCGGPTHSTGRWLCSVARACWSC